MALSDEVKARTSIVALIAQTVTWDAKKSKPATGDYWACCPFHGEATPSFHVTEPKGKGGTFYCFGCQVKGSSIDYLMERDGLSFTAAVRALADSANVERTTDPAHLAKIKAESDERQKVAEDEAERLATFKWAQAQRIWKGSETHAPEIARYLKGRGIDIDVLGGVPLSLRFQKNLQARDDAGRVIHSGPCMVSFIGRDSFIGVHRTWIDGTSRARDRDGQKIPKSMLGRTGHMFGAPIPLTKRGRGVVVVGEGIETTLAGLVWRIKSGTPAAEISAEAAISLGALCGPEDKRFVAKGVGRNGQSPPSPRALQATHNPGWLPPKGVDRTLILADPSTKCPYSAQLNAERALDKIKRRSPDGARLMIPRDHWDHDDDFCDLAKRGELT